MLNILNGDDEDQGPLELLFFFSVNLLLQDAAGLLLHSSESCSLIRKKGNASLLGVLSFVVLQR